MIEQLEYSVRFPPNDRYPLGQSFDRKLSFKKGVTLITGANEVGKTLNLEIFEFLMFGSAALRGAVGDYKGLRAVGIVSIRGTRYRIERTVRNAAINFADGGEEGLTLAVGTKPVNARIAGILGYGLDVFRVANIANQDDVQRLSQMLPAARKAMVDRLIGADQIEALAKWCGEEALGVAREIAGVEKGTGPEPVKPAEPHDYRPADELQARIVKLRADRDRAVQLRAFLANKPVVPELGDRPSALPLSTLEHAEKVLSLRTYDFDLEEARRQNEAHSLWLERQAFDRRVPARPTISADLLADFERAERLERELADLMATEEVTCPCGKPFRLADGEIARVQLALDNLPMKLPGLDLDAERTAHRVWAKEDVQAAWERLQHAVETPHPAHHPREAEGAVPLADVRAELAKTGLPADTTLAEVRRQAGQLRTWEAQQAAHADALARRDAWELQATAAQLELNQVETAFGELDDVVDQLSRAQLYELSMASYRGAFATWAQNQDHLTDLRREERSWRNAKVAMNKLRDETKTHLVPALSRVASHLLARMTAGKRARISVDEDFEVMVDGQPLATLSGSGKICANLALRLALGRILTQGVFPVFMGDELDASMDPERSRSLYEAMLALEGKLTQMLLVTHKQLGADQIITLEA